MAAVGTVSTHRRNASEYLRLTAAASSTLSLSLDEPQFNRTLNSASSRSLLCRLRVIVLSTFGDAMTQSWEALRKEARRLETVIDGRLVEYSKLAASLQSTSSSSRASFDTPRPTSEDEAIQRRGASRDNHTAEEMTADMDALLAQLSSVVDSMSAVQATPSFAHTLQRHTEILHDYNNEFRKTRASITSLRQHAELMAGAGERPRVISAGGGPGLDGLYKERAGITAATSGADVAISTGLNIKEDLDRQRAMFASTVERMETMSEGIPALHRLIGQIRRKKKRDVLIFAAVVSVLLFITFSWKVMH